MNFLKKLYRGASSFGFAAILLLLLLLLTWLGTLEQVKYGLYEVQKKYFESILLVHDFGPFDLRLPTYEGGEFHWSHHPFGPIPIPLPGVYLLLALLLLNLVLGGIVRMKKGQRTAGILVAHLGIVMMLVAGFVKFRYSIEGNLALAPKEIAGRDPLFPRRFQDDVFKSFYDWEISVHEAVEAGTVTRRIIPASDWQWDVERGPVTFISDSLPFDVVVTSYFRNCRVVPKGPMFAGDGPVIDGYTVLKQDPAKEAESNVAGAYVTFVEKSGGRRTDALLYGLEEEPFTIVAGGKPWLVELRKREYKLPFAIRLDKFTFEVHPGTGTASVYLSDVTKIEEGRETSLKITMNEPLRHEGYTLYQSGFGPDDRRSPSEPHYTVFAVVRNPSDQWPKWSCYTIAVGLLWHFASKLLRYIRSQRPVQPVNLSASGAPPKKASPEPAVRTHA